MYLAIYYVFFQRLRKFVSQQTQKKRPRSGNVQPALSAPKRGKRYGPKYMSNKGKNWYKKHTDASFCFDVCIDQDILAREFPKT